MICVIAKIDDAARNKLNKICNVVEEFDFPVRYLYGHITLISYIGQNETEFVNQCKMVLNGYTSFPIAYDRIELLPPTPSIVASPKLTQELVAIHNLLLAVAPCELDSWSSNELWHPHTTLFYHTEADLQTIRERMAAQFSPFSAYVSRIEFSKVTDQGYEIVDYIAL